MLAPSQSGCVCVHNFDKRGGGHHFRFRAAMDLKPAPAADLLAAGAVFLPAPPAFVDVDLETCFFAAAFSDPGFFPRIRRLIVSVSLPDFALIPALALAAIFACAATFALDLFSTTVVFVAAALATALAVATALALTLRFSFCLNRGLAGTARCAAGSRSEASSITPVAASMAPEAPWTDGVSAAATPIAASRST